MSEVQQNYCRQKARESDIDAYLAALFLPEPARSDVWALEALAGELKRVPQSVQEPMLGQIRLQWWREAIGRLYLGAPDPHPLLRALGPVIARTNLPEAQFDAVIAGCEAELWPESLVTDEAREGQSALLALKRHAIFGASGGPSDETLGAAAQALSASAALRHLARHRPGAATGAREWAEQAQTGIAAASRGIQREGVALLLPLAALRLYLARLKRADFAPDAPGLEPPIYQRQWAMLSAIWRGRL
jgi:phytoene synthase